MRCQFFRRPVTSTIRHYRNNPRELAVFITGSVLTLLAAISPMIAMPLSKKSMIKRSLCSTPSVLGPFVNQSYDDVYVQVTKGVFLTKYWGQVSGINFSIPASVSPPWRDWERFGCKGLRSWDNPCVDYEGATTPLPRQLVNIFKDCWEGASDQINSASLDKLGEIALWTAGSILLIGVLAYVGNKCVQKTRGVIAAEPPRYTLVNENPGGRSDYGATV